MPSYAETKVKWILGLLGAKPGEAVLDITGKFSLPGNPGGFNYIINAECPENLADLENSLSLTSSALMAGGKAAFMLPNLYYYRYLVDKFLGPRGAVPRRTMEKLAKRKVWQGILERNGFKVEKIHKDSKFNRNKFMITMRDLLIPLDFSHQFIFICSKK